MKQLFSQDSNNNSNLFNFKIQINDIQNKIKKKDEELFMLKTKLIETQNMYNSINNELLKIKNSRTWKITLFLKRIITIIIPKNSIQRRILKTTYLFIFKNKKLYPILIFPKYNKPIVSIIIPVYNHFDYTYNCLKSILMNSNNVNYEIIIADDNSKDEARLIKRKTRNIKIIKNKKNIQFIKNCNNAAKSAIGKYLVFLNNDTQVQSNWLFPIIDLIEKDETIGLTGSKLIYPNGILQEAGSIVWKDGAAANYGNGCNPDQAEFNYVRDVDYISGASILIRHELWKIIGGFDESYSPAYYEDVDLAFNVRKIGYRVVYQPKSKVIHFEGISHGKNLENGIKKFQLINKEYFYNKWQEILKNSHYSYDINIFLARENSKKQIILIIDRYVPHYDKDAGSRCIYMYIELFLQLGLKIIFLPDNMNQIEPYTSKLQQMGVEVLYGEYYSINWTKWLIENGKYLNYVLTIRGFISIKYIDYIKKYSNAKIIYFNVDMDHLRSKRQYEIQKDKNILEHIKQSEKIEMEMSEKADILYVVGSYEEKILKNLFPNKLIRNIPVFFYKKTNKISLSARERHNLLFIGGFDHSPNEDAVLWFYNYFIKDITKNYQDIIWYIVGSNPSDKILAIQDKNIKVTGYVTDEQLKYFYNSSRILIAPLRFGAGVKGKIIEAAYYGIPIITTNIGVEGLSLEEKSFIINPPDESFCKTIIELYYNYEKLDQLSENCLNFINNHFIIDNAIKIIKNDISN